MGSSSPASPERPRRPARTDGPHRLDGGGNTTPLDLAPDPIANGADAALEAAVSRHPASGSHRA